MRFIDGEIFWCEQVRTPGGAYSINRRCHNNLLDTVEVGYFEDVLAGEHVHPENSVISIGVRRRNGCHVNNGVNTPHHRHCLAIVGEIDSLKQ